jgi:hypothetical protein
MPDELLLAFAAAIASELAGAEPSLHRLRECLREFGLADHSGRPSMSPAEQRKARNRRKQARHQRRRQP